MDNKLIGTIIFLREPMQFLQVAAGGGGGVEKGDTGAEGKGWGVPPFI